MLNERKLTPSELKRRDEIIKNMLHNKRELVSKYGHEAEKVVYGRATNIVMNDTPDDIDGVIESINYASKRVNNAKIYENMTQSKGLNITPTGSTTLDDLIDILEDEGLYYEVDNRENILHLPENPDMYDDLENFLDQILGPKNFDYTVEGIFENQGKPYSRDIEVEGDEYEKIQKLIRNLNLEDDLKENYSSHTKGLNFKKQPYIQKFMDELVNIIAKRTNSNPKWVYTSRNYISHLQGGFYKFRVEANDTSKEAYIVTLYTKKGEAKATLIKGRSWSEQKKFKIPTDLAEEDIPELVIKIFKDNSLWDSLERPIKKKNQ